MRWTERQWKWLAIGLLVALAMLLVILLTLQARKSGFVAEGKNAPSRPAVMVSWAPLVDSALGQAARDSVRARLQGFQPVCVLLPTTILVRTAANDGSGPFDEISHRLRTLRIQGRPLDHAVALIAPGAHVEASGNGHLPCR